MAERRVVTLPFGEGLERSDGRMIVAPTTFEDLRNVHLFDGKAQVRFGIEKISVLQDGPPLPATPADLDVTVMLAPLRAEAASIGVGYNTTGGTNREIWINRMAIDGSNPFAVGLFGTLAFNATFTPPIIIGADSDNRFFFAHDEPGGLQRLVTKVYDPNAFPNLAPLQANLDGDGQAEVFFRGVVRHLSYIFGWGYGSATDPFRNDVVRVSNSGNSKVFEDFAFFEAGQRGEAVMLCRSAGPSLMVFKENETYEIFGYSPDTFGIRLADSLFGCVGSRLAVSVAGSAFFWSTQGPRVTSGGPSVDIAVPLDIGAPDPAGLVEESEPQDAFAQYDPQTRVVQFVWGRRVYALSIRDPNRPRWSYYELGETAQCGGLFFSTQSQAGSGGPPVGAPIDLRFDERADCNVVIGASPTGGVVPIDGETVTIDGKVYTWQAVLTDVDGNVLIGSNTQLCANFLFAAITLGAGAGSDYAASTTLHPTVSINTLAGAAPPRIIVRADADGSAGNDLAVSTTMVQDPIAGVFTAGDGPQFNPGDAATTLTGGVGPPGFNFIEIQFENDGLLGGEDIEVHTSKDGGASYGFSGAFPATGLPGGLQTIRVTKEVVNPPSVNLQPLTDYKFSLRYRLGGLFSPGYDSIDPNDWDDPDFDSQGETETTADAIVTIQRPGDNTGLYDRLQQKLSRITVDVGLPSGHASLDVEVFLEVQATDTDPDQFTGLTRGTVLAADSLRAIWNSDSPGYPNQYIDEFPRYPDEGGAPFHGALNLFRFRFVNGAKQGPFSEPAICYAGPDPPLRNSQTLVLDQDFFGIIVFHNWLNAVTPTTPRNCPAVPPTGHSLDVKIRNADNATGWISAGPPGGLPAGIGMNPGNEDPFSVQARGFVLVSTGPFNDGDRFRMAVRHLTECFSAPIPFTPGDRSEWAFMDDTPNFVETQTVP